jgi:four helix bundle protein
MCEEGGGLRRSSRSMTSCILGAYGRRRFKAELVKFLIYAHASCDETILHLKSIRDTHELDEKKYGFSFTHMVDWVVR